MVFIMLLWCAGITLTLKAQVGCGPTVKEFKAKLEADETTKAKIAQLKSDVEAFACLFPMPGHDDI